MVKIMPGLSRIQASYPGKRKVKISPPPSISAGQARVAAVNNAIIIFTLRQYDKNRCKFIIMIRNCDSSCIFKIRWGNWPYLYQRGWLKGVVSFPADK
ncbi:hypothetical protein FML15_25180 [Klebsiella michiganensis]|nr:hypothetical protein [Klebsiella michiganensis]MBZ7429298.1 hypothetical protein [Klebsiella michiganensis]MBZ7580578.1 hypothetical protein [Klebsiella michiganensis]TXV08468.1 hypothetical protein D4M92_03950 [Klebsiella michiganensis]